MEMDGMYDRAHYTVPQGAGDFMFCLQHIT